jgi:hypothetical protein
MEARTRAVTYCSFADETGCLGVVVLEGVLGVVDAARMCHALGVNPGGEMLVASCDELSPDVEPRVFSAMWDNRNRLISGDEARRLFEAKSLREWEADA